MEPVEYLYLAILSVFCFSLTCAVYKNIYKKGRQADNRYKLYKIRDDLIFLVAKGSIKEDDFIFKTFYWLTNTYVHEIHKFTLKEINKAMQDAKEKGYLKEPREFTLKIEEELRNKDKEVKDVIQEFFQTNVVILIRNSLTLKLMVTYIMSSTLAGIIRKKGRIFEALFPTQEVGYRNYQTHNEIYNSLASANC